MGEVVKFVTKQPDLNHVSGNARIDGSQIDGGGAGYGLRGSINPPVVTHMVGLGASAFYRNDSGFVDADQPKTPQKAAEIAAATIVGPQGERSAR